jgi:hypothetical protein
MKALIKNLTVVAAYGTMFFFVINKILKIDTKKSIGLAFIISFVTGLLNAIYIEVTDINNKVKSNDITKSSIS